MDTCSTSVASTRQWFLKRIERNFNRLTDNRKQKLWNTSEKLYLKFFLCSLPVSMGVIYLICDPIVPEHWRRMLPPFNALLFSLGWSLIGYLGIPLLSRLVAIRLRRIGLQGSADCAEASNDAQQILAELYCVMPSDIRLQDSGVSLSWLSLWSEPTRQELIQRLRERGKQRLAIVVENCDQELSDVRELVALLAVRS